MRVVFVSNYYPPIAHGGYEQWCQEVASELRHRGNTVAVLTSHSPSVPPIDDDGIEVRRHLNLEVEGGVVRTAARLLTSRRRREAENLARTRRMIEEFRPDVALIWGMWNVPRSVPALIEQILPERVAYYLCDYWLSLPSAFAQQLDNPAERTISRVPKRLLSRALSPILARDERAFLQLWNPICVSRAVRDLLLRDGVSIQHARIIQGGIQVDDFDPLALQHWNRGDGSLRLLYAGRLTEEKGVHTAVQALSKITGRPDRPVTLDLVGSGEPRYRKELRAAIKRHGLEEAVRFRARVPRAHMPELLAEYDALIFPSEWQEPFGRMVMEAMAVGLVVVGTTTGGTGDVLVENETGLTFPPGDAAALARQIERLRDDRALGRGLAHTARRTVEERFAFTRMVDEIEDCLQGIGAAPRR